ncbi:type II toxin-antitoxin system VapC family toxin [Nocardia farcinica]|uniref:type II toxin-antitoxin system VapC family toxin n=1 Tax=Nocardia farcinica TaxID=37329 RepID=UPI000A3D0C28|nr:type II toxin-antitoxin system VapC family toxin [Nocardia farcinica]MBA4855911.1 type II toxin-antitoxin system VapC family toxin [Nocardia farcinica]MBC9818532.1 type II toxin-antitoxin system VapC family toxin [Nocardia farcinica]MBF6265845.1 type II toxin-antitoxin system VapC family toxin [Nocardia farcinica]MBF6284320.1 type II toxin-antitoxin system VapC family toxin [Nocardia farcinica]MBF6308804.1 type II toxin-antitoxin system VapC family toxin [Nocardia farcinica]
MSFLLDTNVLSELRKSARAADPGVRAWVAARRPSELYLTVVTVMEIEIGVGRVERRDPAQGKRLRTWLEDDVLDVFAGRILGLDLAAARRAAQWHVPDPRPERDTLIAAIASEHGMTLVTRNVRDFAPMNVPLIDPWGR